MGLFRSPRSRPGAPVRRKAGSAYQTDRITSLVSKWGCSAHEGAGQVALVRRKAGSAHQTDRITSLVSKWGCSAHQGAGQVPWCAGRPVPLTKSNRCGHGRSAVGSRQRGTGSGERAAGSGERTGRRNRLRKGSAAKALIIQHLNADNCLQIRIILTTIAKNRRRQDRGESRG